MVGEGGAFASRVCPYPEFAVLLRVILSTTVDTGSLRDSASGGLARVSTPFANAATTLIERMERREALGGLVRGGGGGGLVR